MLASRTFLFMVHENGIKGGETIGDEECPECGSDDVEHLADGQVGFDGKLVNEFHFKGKGMTKKEFLEYIDSVMEHYVKQGLLTEA